MTITVPITDNPCQLEHYHLINTQGMCELLAGLHGRHGPARFDVSYETTCHPYLMSELMLGKVKASTPRLDLCAELSVRE